MTAEPFIEIRKVRRTFGAIVAVDDVDLDIGHGAFFSLLGPSGCGKTTLLRMLAGLEYPSSGTIRIDGADVTREPSYRRPTNMVFQSYAVFPHLTVADNIAYGLRRLGIDKPERRRRVERMLEMIHLPGYGERRPHQLSGGQMQRVALARALILQPKVLLLDEPLAALDKRLRENMQVELRAIQRKVGITFVFVTHDQEEALTLSDQVAVMSGGKVLQCSSPVDLYERPATREVAEFVGEMNFLPARVRKLDADAADVEIAGFGVMRLALPRHPLAVGDAALIAVRPERFLVATATAADGWRIVDRAYFGNRTHLMVAVPSLAKPLIVTLSAEGARDLRSDEGMEYVTIRPDAAAAITLPA